MLVRNDAGLNKIAGLYREKVISSKTLEEVAMLESELQNIIELDESQVSAVMGRHDGLFSVLILLLILPLTKILQRYRNSAADIKGHNE